MNALIIDNDDRHSTRLIAEFRRLSIGAVGVTALAAGLEAIARHRPSLVLSEVIVDTVSWHRTLHRVVVASSGARVAFITSYPSMASTAYATRIGAGYFTKPVAAQALVDWYEMAAEGAHGGFADGVEESGGWPTHRRMSLDRAVWEIINQAVAENESLSSAAAQLGIDRRSLRRMLSKYPPAR